MKTGIFIKAVMIALILCIFGCGDGDKELQKDTKIIADAMCKNLDAMHKLRIASPEDSILIKKLQGDIQKIQDEMKSLYQEFNRKFGEKTKTFEFSKKFRKYLSVSILDCKNLSKEDRETFEKDAR